eukprot:Gb_26969 [translate_table: standard]
MGLIWAMTIVIFMSSSAAMSRELSGVPKSHQVLDVAATLREAEASVQVPKRPLSIAPEQRARGGWSLQVMHRDAMLPGLSNRNASYEQRLRERLTRDGARVRGLNARLERGYGGRETESVSFGSEIISGMEQGSGEYFTRIGVGTPPRDQYMVLDTGSDVVWIQCRPCSECYEQADPIFDPSLSASFAAVSCDSAVCSQLDTSDCHGGGCLYQVSYGDGSYTLGNFATDTLTFGTTSVRNVAIGCGHDNEGLFVGAAGLLGLGAGSLSFPTQLGTQTGRVFSYCLVDRDSGSASTLDFGSNAEVATGGAATVFASLLKNPRMETFYYVTLTAISVGGVQVSIPPDVFRVDETGHGGVIIDSGTAITRLQSAAYSAMRDAFVARTRDLPRAEGISIFDTCYDLSGRQSVSVPTVAFHFLNGAFLSLPAKNYLIPVDSMGTFCFAFAPTDAGLSIIGNVQQQSIRVSFDSANSLVGFALDQC